MRKIILAVIGRLEYQTGFGPGAQAEKLADEIIDALKVEDGRLAALHALEVELAADPEMVLNVEGEIAAVRLAPDFRVEGASMGEVLEMFDNTAPKFHAQLATELLALARRSGGAGDVVSYLQLVADADVVEGVFTIVWPQASGLPAPGQVVTLDATFPEQVRGTVQVVGFGRVEGSLRVRPLHDSALDELGPERQSISSPDNEEEP